MTLKWVNRTGGLIFTEQSKDSFDVVKSVYQTCCEYNGDEWLVRIWDLHWVINKCWISLIQSITTIQWERICHLNSDMHPCIKRGQTGDAKRCKYYMSVKKKTKRPTDWYRTKKMVKKKDIMESKAVMNIEMRLPPSKWVQISWVCINIKYSHVLRVTAKQKKNNSTRSWKLANLPGTYWIL